MKKQTAVQWLYDELSQCMHREEVCDLVYKLEQKAKQMERKQITDAYSTYAFDEHGMRIHASQYYNETFGGQDEK
jgi:hypothetical protein